MKKYFYLTILSALVAGCASDGIIEQLPEAPNTPNGGAETDMPMGFVVSSQNMTRATMLQDVDIYNFGVFAYKSSETSSSVMDNYLVGYMNVAKKAGYYMTKDNQTTLGDGSGTASGESMWAYEKMGNTEYDYTGGDGYYRKDDKRYISNNSKQYLKYWDKAADNTMFYAYTPYVNKDFTSTAVTFDNSTKTLDIPSGAIKDGYNNNTDYEFMYAVTQVNKDDYGKDVSLQFKHMTSKISIKFYEDLEGYDVRVINLSNSYGGIYAVPSIKSAAGTYSRGTYYKSTGAKIVFNGTTAELSQVGAVEHDVTKASELLMFAAPEVQKIATTSVEATPSPTSYYGIPKSDATGGLTFHVSYELTSDTGERITINNATAYVPANMCNWQPNSHYTYIFKITKNSNGTTEDNPVVDPTDPDVPAKAALLPIVFDNCTIEEWTEVDGDDINVSDAYTKYYSISLNQGNVIKGNSVVATLLERGNAATSAAGTWSLTKPGETVTLSTADAKTVTVAVGSDWANGKYTLTFTPDDSMDAPNTKYEADFYVIDAYAVSLNSTEVGTRGKAQSELTIASDPYALSGNLLSIEYPTDVTSGDDKAKVYIKDGKVIVKKDAVPGAYKIVYKIGDDVKTSAAFTVVDYNPDTNIPGNRVEKSQDSQTFTVTPAKTTADMTYTLDVPTGADASKVILSGNTITVMKDATVGQYKLTLVVNNNGTKTTYERTFEVVNVYSLTLSRYTVDNDEAYDGHNVTVEVTAKANGAVDTTTPLTITNMSGVSLTDRTITIVKDAIPSNYIVTYTVGGEVVARATLVVTD